MRILHNDLIVHYQPNAMFFLPVLKTRIKKKYLLIIFIFYFTKFTLLRVKFPPRTENGRDLVPLGLQQLIFPQLRVSSASLSKLR